MHTQKMAVNCLHVYDKTCENKAAKHNQWIKGSTYLTLAQVMLCRHMSCWKTTVDGCS